VYVIATETICVGICQWKHFENRAEL